MIKPVSMRTVWSLLAATVVLAACQGSPTPPPATATSPASTDTPAAVSGDITPTAGPTPALPSITLPAGLELSGSLIFTDNQAGVGRFDFASGEVTSLYRPPAEGFVDTAVLSPDGQTLLLTYSPPPDPDNPQYVASSIYALPADGSGEPSRLLPDDGSENFEFTPEWSPDGSSVYYGQYAYPPQDGSSADGPTGYLLARYTLPDGPSEILLSNVLTARISADGSQLVYISLDPTTLLSNLYVADPDGNNATSLLPDGDTWIIDAVAIAPDGETLVYSQGAEEGEDEDGHEDEHDTSLSWLAQLMGVQVASAHSVPSDLWRVKVGEAPQQLTHLADDEFVVDYSPDGAYIIFSCSSGVYLMGADGSDLTELAPGTNFTSVQWIP